MTVLEQIVIGMAVGVGAWVAFSIMKTDARLDEIERKLKQLRAEHHWPKPILGANRSVTYEEKLAREKALGQAETR